jgi:hypothetical protein
MRSIPSYRHDICTGEVLPEPHERYRSRASSAISAGSRRIPALNDRGRRSLRRVELRPLSRHSKNLQRTDETPGGPVRTHSASRTEGEGQGSR